MKLTGWLGAALVLGIACAPSAGPASSGTGAPPAKKIITIADTYEPKFIVENFSSGGPPLTANNIRFIVHDDLLRSLGYPIYQPQLAAEIPSVEAGTWKINPDGTMDTTWKLRPNFKWHDGQPFSSADLAFTFQMRRDRDVAGTALTSQDQLQESTSTPDPLTFVVHWKGPYVDAYSTNVGQILPKHLLDEMYQRDKSSLQTTPLTNTEFVGLGPYRLVSWERGSHVQAERFDDYYQGRPPLDTIYVRFMGNGNAQVTSILAGAVDVAVSSSELRRLQQ
jgi:peptide/nickel transport system substrate-binding protein